jgi:hypothetical protein
MNGGNKNGIKLSFIKKLEFIEIKALNKGEKVLISTFILRFVSTSLQKRTNELNLLYIYIYN